jgi:hypothetical protein
VSGIVGSEQRVRQSEMEHVPPESARMLAFTARMYAMVRNVAVPARSSVVKVVLRSVSLKCLPTLVVDMYVFRRVESEGFSSCDGNGSEGGVSIFDKMFLVQQERERENVWNCVCMSLWVLGDIHICMHINASRP